MQRKHRYRASVRGFTIIEVMVVLAIAALILVVILIAVPLLQRSQRNHRRKSTIQLIAAHLETAKANNKGVYPLDGTFTPPTDARCDFIRHYLDSAFTSCSYDSANNCMRSDGPIYNVCFHSSEDSHEYVGDHDEVSIEMGHLCAADPSDTEHIVSGPSGDDDPTRIVIWTKLEPNIVYCVDNHNPYGP